MKFLVSVFKGGKNVFSRFQETLHNLPLIRALHRGCEIEVYDMESSKVFKDVPKKKDFLRVINIPKVTEEPKRKVWELSVMCPETGKVYKSIRECSDDMGIPYKTIDNCLRRGNATRTGYHFSYVENNRDGQEEKQ